MITIEDYWKIDDFIQNEWGKNAYKFIDYCGLEPVRPMKHFGYFCTPKNSKTFASTGGDGVHFGLVDGVNDKGTPGPIVMTVPMADNNNVIIAEDLTEFFSLGYHVGWFALEQIVYDLENTIAYYSNPDEEITEEENRFLRMIREELLIQHILLSKERLSELEKKYFKRLEIGDLDEWYHEHNIT